MKLSSSELLELAKRVLNAFKHYECFVFEKSELDKVKKLLEDAGLRKHVVVRRADPRYEEIYIILPWQQTFETECVNYVTKLVAEGKVNKNYYKKNRNLMILQCIKHMEREKVKEIISLLENYIERGASSGASTE